MARRRDRQDGCTDCGSSAVRIILGGEPLCDRCHDVRVSAETGWPRLPDPPAPETISGPDGRRHKIAYRLWRSPTGLVIEAEERRPQEAEGYAARVMGAHDADVEALVTRLRAKIRERIERQDLEPSSHGPHMIVRDMELRGRLVWNGRHGPYDVVIDGRQLTWEELGQALEPFEGWEFSLRFDDGLDYEEPASSEADELGSELEHGEDRPWPPVPDLVH